MVNYQQLHFTASQTELEPIFETLEQLHALAITVSDAEDRAVDEMVSHDHPPIPVWSTTKITALFSADVNIELIIQQLCVQYHLHRQENSFELESIPDKDWVRVSRDAIKPLCFGEHVWICPSWEAIPEIPSKNKTNKKNIVISLDPGLAFGTGSHPTTQLCIDWLVTHRQAIQHKTLIDYGCGSGILGIVALKLGAKQVVSVDIDPQALMTTRENAEKNHVNLTIFTPEQFTASVLQADIIIANILAGPLIDMHAYFSAYLHSGSQLILSGILEEQETWINSYYHHKNHYDYHPAGSAKKDGWLRMAFFYI